MRPVRKIIPSSAVKALKRTGITAIIVGLTAFAASPSQSGAPAKRTGAPGDGTGAPGSSGTCSDVGCHNSFDLNSGPGSVTLAVPAVYTPGETVPITVSVAQGGAIRFGFEITAKDANGDHLGSWVLGTNTRKTIGNPNYLTHSVITESEWTFGWASPTAPANATFYVAGNAADGKFDAAGDHIYTTSKLIVPNVIADVDGEAEVGKLRIDSVFPHPVRDRAQVSVTLPSAVSTMMLIVDITGREVGRTDFGVLPTGKHNLPISMADLPSGLYAVSIQAGDERVGRSLTVLRGQ